MPDLRFLIPILSALLLLSGCASSKWAPELKKEAELAWPPPPRQAKITYVGELKGFDQISSSLATFLTGRSNNGRILKPVAVAVSGEGDLAIADQDRKGVHLFNRAEQKYSFLFKTENTRLGSPVGLAFHQDGRLFITDSLLEKILIFSREGVYLDSIDRAGEVPLVRPTGIDYNDKDHKIYVSDTTNHRILALNGENYLVETFGVRGEGKGELNFPTHIDSGPDGRIYITDSLNFRTQILNPGQKKWQAFGGHGNGSGNFASPKGIAVDSAGFIYIAEALFDTVQIFNEEGQYLLGLGSRGTGPAGFWMPSGITIDHQDRLYVCDTYNKRVQIFQLHTGDSQK